MGISAAQKRAALILGKIEYSILTFFLSEGLRPLAFLIVSAVAVSCLVRVLILKNGGNGKRTETPPFFLGKMPAAAAPGKCNGEGLINGSG